MTLGNITTQQMYRGGEHRNDKGSTTKKERKRTEAQVVFSKIKIQFVFVHV